MQLSIITTLSDDNNVVSVDAKNCIAVSTSIPGVDAEILKQDFIGQADALLRIVSENMIPALYAEVNRLLAENAEPAETEAQEELREKLRSMKARKQDTENAEEQK